MKHPLSIITHLIFKPTSISIAPYQSSKPTKNQLKKWHSGSANRNKKSEKYFFLNDEQ